MFPPLAAVDQHPAGDTPGVAAAPVALAGAIVPGVARSIVTLSAQDEAFGVGIGAAFGSMLVSPDAATTGPIVPGAGVVATSGVDNGSDAALTVGPPGAVLQTTVDEVPTVPDVTVPVGLAVEIDGRI